MSADSVTTKGLKELRRDLVRTKNLLKQGDKKIMAVVGKTVIEYIIKRTAQGISYEGGAFKKYTKAYAKKWGSNVTLKRTGKMQGAISKQILGGFEIRIFVENKSHTGKINTYNLTIIHNYGMGVNPKRPFFGLTEQETEKIFQMIDKLISSKLHQFGWSG